jgi:hypothetical protein
MPIEFDDVMFTRGSSGTRAYGQSKLAQIMFTFDLADGVRLPPGWSPIPHWTASPAGSSTPCGRRRPTIRPTTRLLGPGCATSSLRLIGLSRTADAN